MTKRIWGLLAFCAVLLSAPTVQAKSSGHDFYLHNGDTVVFYGDSITEQLMYGRDIETYVVTRFPGMHVKFINSGWSGDRVTGGGGGPIDLRLKRDVLPYKPTVVTILLGMNDGNYSSFDQGTYDTYTHGLTHIVDTLTQQLPGVRITLLTPSLFDYGAKDRTPPPAGQGYNFGQPAPDYNSVLVKFGDFIRQFGAQRHLLVVDMNAPMLAATQAGRQADPHFALSGDGVHPNEVGHLIMAATVLKAWNAPATVANITLRPGKSVTVTTPLPWPVPDSAKQAFTVSPLPGSLDVFEVHGSHLPNSDKNAIQNYALQVDGTTVANVTAAQLNAGVDLTQYPTLPENQQAQQVLNLVNQRIGQWHDFWKGNNGLVHANDVPTDAEVASLTAEDTSLDPLRAQEQTAAQPTPHTFVWNRRERRNGGNIQWNHCDLGLSDAA